MKESFLTKRNVTWIFAIISIISGFFFLDSGPTGNIIINKQSSISILSIIGLLLIACSAVLITYSVKKK